MENADKLTPQQWEWLATALLFFGLFCGAALGVLATLFVVWA